MSLDQFFADEVDNSPYSDRVCQETRKRIRVAVAAWAYEVMDVSIMTDAEFDELAKSIDLSIDTRRPDLDKWYRKNFKTYTGSWVHGHPDKTRLNQIVEMVINKMGKIDSGKRIEHW